VTGILIWTSLGAGTSTSRVSLAVLPHDVHLIYLPVDDKWDPYRADPRFQALLERGGFTAPASPVPAAR
jgi:hypothetical protein